MTKICRLCLSNNGIISLFSNNENLCAKLMSITRLKVLKDDGFPQIICEDCQSTLLLSYNFKIKCENSDTFLKTSVKVEPQEEAAALFHFADVNNILTIKGEINDEESIKATNESVVLETEVLVFNEDTNTCSNFDSNEPIINQEEPDDNIKEEQSLHFVDINDKEDINVKCFVDNLHDSKPETRTTRTRKAKYKSKESEEPIIEGNVTNTKRVYRKRGSEPLKCEYCPKTFQNTSKYTRHVRWHTGERPYKCSECDKSYPLPFLLTVHLRTHSGQKPFVCDTCGKAFTSRSGFNKHKETHNDNIYECLICKKKFKTKSLLRDHGVVHTKEKRFVCTICGKRFTQSGGLSTHMNIHNDIKRFSCDICGRGFNLKHTLSTHMLVHTGEKNHHCEICKQNFRTQTSLSNHIKTHTGQRDHKCDECDAAFVTKTQLRLHFVRHTGEKPFVCKFCGMKFSVPSTMRGHVKRRHMNIIYRCKYCHIILKNDSALQRHIKANHKNKTASTVEEEFIKYEDPVAEVQDVI